MIYFVFLLRKCCLLEIKCDYQQSEFEILFEYLYDFFIKDIYRENPKKIVLTNKDK